jgi:RimJ/RimL family protein N-acetyltransferase
MKKWPDQYVPVVETERLTLRAHRPEDFEACAQLWADPEVTWYITGQALTGEEVWSRLLRYVGHWYWLRFGYWAVEEKSSGLFIGEAGFADYKREIIPAISGTPELGCVLASSAHGKGYATEALQAIVAWGDRHFENARTVCIVSPDNRLSLRVAEKCGYKEYQRGTYKGRPTVMLERIKQPAV